MAKKTDIDHAVWRRWLLWRRHPRLRLVVSALLAIAIFAVLPSHLRPVTRLLIGWDGGVFFYLAWTFVIMSLATIADIRRRAAVQDEGRIALLILTVAAALASLGAIVVELGKAQGAGGAHSPNLVVAALTILLSWAFIHVIFALHYAHEFYSEGADDHCGGLDFPGEEEADYWDFLYFSFVIGMTSQTSDVQVTSRAIRQTVLAHGIVAFVFNATIVALTVNMAASVIAPGQ